MPKWGLIAVAALLSVLAVAGCGSAHPSPANPRHGLAEARFDRWLSFRYPAAWVRTDCPGQITSFTNTLTYLTTSRPSACSGSNFPVGQLSKNGVLVRWWGYGFPSPSHGIARFPGRLTTIDHRPARIATSSHVASFAGLTTGCSSIGAQRVMAVVIERKEKDNWLIATVCLRGPEFTSNETAVRRMLSTVQLGS